MIWSGNFGLALLPLMVAAGLAAAEVPIWGGQPPDSYWRGIRGGARAPGSLAWSAELPPPRISEWMFRNRGRRRHKLGLAVWASPALAVVDGKPMAFIGGYDQTMHALDIATRERIWFRITNGEISSAPAVDWVDGRQVVFWGAADRTLYAHFADDGSRLWTRELVQPTSTMGEAILSSPLVHGNTIYITCFVYDQALSRYEQKGWLFALDLATGRPLWQFEVSQGPLGSPTGCEVDGRFVVFVAARKGLLRAIDVSGGVPNEIWTFQMPQEVFGAPALRPHPDRPLVFLGSKFGNFKAIDARDGREVWQRMGGNWFDNTAALGQVDGEDIVFAGCHDYNLYAFHADTGENFWTQRLPGEIFSAPSFFHYQAKPVVAAATHDNHLYVLDARDGQPVTAFFIGLPIWELVSKGDTLWGSPVVFETPEEAVIVHGSWSDVVMVVPVGGDSLLRAQPSSPANLWYGMGIVMALFLLVVMPVVKRLPIAGDPKPA